MSAWIQLIGACLVCSALISYLWWLKFRVWIFRQDLFEIRDLMWDRAKAEGLLEHPDYQSVRDKINVVIRVAPLFQAASFYFIISQTWRRQTATLPTLPLARETLESVAKRAMRFICYESFMGFVTLLIIKTSLRREPWPDISLAAWIESDALRETDLNYTRSQRLQARPWVSVQ